METERNNEGQKRMEEIQNEILKMVAVVKMCRDAPKDEGGNVVVSVVGIPNIGLFYQFNN